MPLQLAMILLVPAAILTAARRWRPLAVIGPILVAYLVGIVWGQLGPLAPSRSAAMLAVQAAVPLAIALLLFNTDFVRWLRLARSAVVSFALAVGAVLAAAVVGALLFRGRVDEWWQVAGMLVGVYTGGTANLTAIGLALGVREETFVLVNAADVLASSIYLLFLLSVAQRLYQTFLPRFRAEAGADTTASDRAAVSGRPPYRDMALGLLLAGAVVAAAVGVAQAVTGRMEEALVILLITTLGVAASFIPRVRRLQGTAQIADYLLLVFAVAIGSIADFRQLASAPLLLGYVALVVALSVIFHLVLAAIFRIDADTVIITSTAAVFSAPFVSPVAAAIRNPEVVVSGLTTAVVGYAVGNYLGLMLAYLLRP